MDQSLSEPLDFEGAFRTVEALFNKQIRPPDLSQYEMYLRYYHNELNLLSFGLKEQWRLPELPVQTHEDLRRLIGWLSDNKNSDLKSLRERMSSELALPNANARACDESIELALRLWLTLNIRRDNQDAVTVGSPSIQWPETGVSLADFVTSQFQKPSLSAVTNIRFNPHFTVAYMSQACGLELQWTYCLADHLRTDPIKKTIRVYHFKRCLSDKKISAGSIGHNSSPLIPADLLQETIWTLNLLFPADDERTAAYLKKFDPPRTFHYDFTVDDRRPLELDTYTYYNQRLKDLLEIYNQGPTTMRQYMSQQKPHERITLLVAVVSGFLLALLFGTISSVTAIISTRATLQALEVSRRTYELQQQVPICPCS